jgi:hypothetical protein
MSETPNPPQGGLERLLSNLVSRTKAKSITWDMLPSGSFAWASDHGAILLRSRDRDGAIPYILTIVNEEGESVEEFEIPSDVTTANTDNLTRELWGLVRSFSRSPNPVLNALIEDLESKPGR